MVFFSERVDVGGVVGRCESEVVGVVRKGCSRDNGLDIAVPAARYASQKSTDNDMTAIQVLKLGRTRRIIPALMDAMLLASVFLAVVSCLLLMRGSTNQG
jgi:hypothetical protein